MDTKVVYGPGILLEQARPPSGKQWTLSSERLRIGRDPSSDVFVDDPGMSRHHADLIRQGSGWSIVDAGSTNGTYVNGARVQEIMLRPGDRIVVGDIELILREPGVNPSDHQGRVARYDVGSQVGNISNVAGDQNYYHESNLRYIASRRGRARVLIISGLLLFFVGQGLLTYAVLEIQGGIFDAFNNPSLGPTPLPSSFGLVVGLGAFLTLGGVALFVFGLIARSGAKQEAQRRGVRWS